MKRSLIAFQALLASSAVLCQSAEATSIFNAPDQTNNTVEARIEAARNGNGGGGWRNGGGGFANW